MKLLLIAVALLVSGCGPMFNDGVIVRKEHQKARSGHTTSFVPMNVGRGAIWMHPITSTYYVPESWSVVYQNSNYNQATVEVDSDTWNALKVGDRFNYSRYQVQKAQ